jgi:parallel beta-helix repeat protein
MQKNIIKKGLAFAVILLFIFMSITPSSAFDNIKKSSVPVSSGNTLYVGGSGPDNYTSIQDAIDNASDEDVIFVCKDSSPYCENIIINKSIALIGEEEKSTIIDGMFNANTIWVKNSSVQVRNFTVINSRDDHFCAGINVIEKLWWQPSEPPSLSNVHIENCTVENNSIGIRFTNTKNGEISFCHIHHNHGSSIYFCNGSYIVIHDCYIHDNGLKVSENSYYSGGICLAQQEMLEGSDNILISNCTIVNNFDGIDICCSSVNIEVESNILRRNTHFGIDIWDFLSFKTSLLNININNNNISNNGGGIRLLKCKNSVNITRNNILNNHDGIYLMRSSNINIVENNLIGNSRNGFFEKFSFFNYWDKNYWSDLQRAGPKIILGRLFYQIFPWFNFDWHPAHEPYDIPT